MKSFELFDKIINWELRPDKFSENGKKLSEKIDTIIIPEDDYFNYLKYLDKSGASYTLTVKEAETGKIVLREKRNAEYKELIDIDIPPPPDEKGERYLDLIQFEHVRNVSMMDQIIENKSKQEIEDCGIKYILRQKKLWLDLKHYQKLIITGKHLDYLKSNDFVLMVVKLYLERTAIEFIDRFEPYVENNLMSEFIDVLFGEKNRRIKEINEAIRKIELRRKLKIDKEFDVIFEKLTKANTIEEKIFNEIEFWKKQKYKSIEVTNSDQLEIVASGMIEFLESELDRAKVTGWVRGQQIELEKAEKLYSYFSEVLSEFKPTEVLTGKNSKKQKWNKNKSEFARFINEQYECNGDLYASRRLATYKLFDEYEFEDKNWTKEKCYELVKKT